MLGEVLRLLAPAPGEVYVDCTAGLGGHASSIAAAIGPTGTIILNDTDAGNLARAAANVRAACEIRGTLTPRIELLHGNFAELPWRVHSLGLKANMIFADLGFASNQVDDAARGLSFMRDGPLDMRLDQTKGLTAADLVNSMSERELARTIEEFGEERQAGRIARKLVQARAAGPISTTAQLADLVRSVVPRSGGRIDPATRTFQALRISVNDELGSLEALLAGLDMPRRAEWLAAGCRVGFLTFHSLEDRPVKRAFVSGIERGAYDVSGGAVAAGEAEIEANGRARSAKLRVVRYS
jgi:16S rRNA (cytosine1402-N4)-methyltransferase